MTKSSTRTTPALAEFISSNPWPEEWTDRGKPVEYIFRIHFSLSAEDLWAVLSDTSRINEAMGLPRMDFHEEEGRTYGGYIFMGARHEWYEAPWEWVHGRFIKMERIFRSGFALYQRAVFLIEESDSGTIPVSFYFGWIPKSGFWKTVLVAFRKRFIANMTRSLESIKPGGTGEIAFFLQGAGAGAGETATAGGGDFNTDRFQRAVDGLRKTGQVGDTILNRFASYLAGAPDDRLSRLRPLQIAREAGISIDDLVPVMLHLTKSGVLNLKWEILCPNCRGVKGHIDHLWETPGGGVCDKCSIDFRKSGLELLEIAFHLNPEIKRVDEVLFCSAEPAKKPQVLVQKKIGPGETHELTLDLAVGRYRLIRMDVLGMNFLDILPDAGETEVFWSSGDSGRRFTTGPSQVLHMKNELDVPAIFVVQDNGIDRDVFRPADLFNYQEFRDLYPDEKLADGISIDIGMQNIIFVDVAGSSALYRSVGDARAFSIIRGFYKKAHDIARAFRGTIVKTVGDAVMLAFPEPRNALRAALQFVAELDGSDMSVPVKARVTVNRGPCLAVNMNSAIDYFGNPVNTVAKLQGFVAGGEIGITRDFIEEASVADYLRAKNFNFSAKKTCRIKGIGDVDYWVIRARRRDRS